MTPETAQRLLSRRNRVCRTGAVVTKRFLSAKDCAAERDVYEKLAGSGLSPSLIEAGERRIVTEYVDGSLLFDELEAGLNDPARQMQLFDLFFSWSEQFYRQTGLILGDSNFRNFILDNDRLYGVDFETCRPGCPAEDAVWQVAMLATLKPAFTSERIRCARRFLAHAPERIYGSASEILPRLPKAFRAICTRRRVPLDASAYDLIASTLDVAACVLAGGQSSRMGRDKRTLFLQGDTFLDTALRTVELYSEKYLSLRAEDPMNAEPGYQAIRDRVRAKGPIGGISEVLRIARNPWILFLPCDMPLMDFSLLDELVQHRRPDRDAFLFTERGVLHTFPLLLRTAAASPVFDAALKSGDLKLRKTLEKHLRIETIEVTNSRCYRENALSNINTWEEYERLRKIT